MPPFEHIAVIGAGNVGYHLALHLHHSGFAVDAIYSRNPTKAGALAELTGAQVLDNPENLPAAIDLVIIAVSDSAIAEVAARLPDTAAVVVHTAGSVDMEVLSRFRHYGVLYPLQSFSVSRQADISSVPLLPEAVNDTVFEKITSLAARLSTSVTPASSEERRFVHLAAVFAANFTNALYGAAAGILGKNTSLGLDILLPLMTETAAKAVEIGPKAAQTGPAKRNDHAVIQKHLNLLPPELRSVYEKLTELIQRQQNEEL